ncbi:hypothetical protein BC828DRAFT_177960 [Blastocladiella britannica]|nr:hypothetical protein BC828DRAFT_177960 [Blastocladiella britannica]
MPIQLPPDPAAPRPSAAAFGATASSLLARVPTINSGSIGAAAKAVPLATRTYLAVLVATFLISAMRGMTPAVGEVCHPPHALFAWSSLLTIWVSPLLQASFLLLIINGLAGGSIMAHLERKDGSLAAALSVGLVLPLLIAVAHWAFHGIFYFVGLVRSIDCTVGNSGVMFALFTASCMGADFQPAISGQVRIPAIAYPWILLVLVQLFYPDASFVGHLAAISVGLIVSQLPKLLQPPAALADRIETSSFPVLRRITSLASYVPHEPATALPRYASVTGDAAAGYDTDDDARPIVGAAVGGSASGPFSLGDDGDAAIPGPGALLHEAPAGHVALPPSPQNNALFSDSDDGEDPGSPLVIPANPKEAGRLLI